MKRSIQSRGLSPLAGPTALAAARWLPTLTVGAIVERSSGASARDHTMVVGALSWPLEAESSAEVENERWRRQASADRQRLVDRIAESWRRRRQAQALEDDVAAELGTEEADAELDVLTGRADEDGP
jgi:hypothetical protein